MNRKMRTNRGTALHYASHYNRINVVRMLVEAKANTKLLDSKGCTPLKIALEGLPNTLEVYTFLKSQDQEQENKPATESRY